jgi:hypothetical protein
MLPGSCIQLTLIQREAHFRTAPIHTMPPIEPETMMQTTSLRAHDTACPNANRHCPGKAHHFLQYCVREITTRLAVK